MRTSLVLYILFFSFIGRADVIEVCSTCSYSSIKSAVVAASEHDTILVKEGTYYEHDISLDKPIHLKAEGHVVIDGEFKSTIIHCSTNNFSIDGFTLKNVGKSFIKEFAAIHLYKCDSFKVTNNNMELVFFGCLIEKSHYGEIAYNNISSNSEIEASSGNGTHAWHSSNLLIHNNKYSGLRDGIYFEFVTDSEIHSNHSSGNLRYGLHFMFSDNDIYHHNTFTNNGAGVAVMFSKFIEMHHNVFKENWGTASYGLLLKEIYDGAIYANTFEENTIGINVEGSNRIKYTKNIYRRNGWAVKIVGACYENHFTENDFLHNSFDLSYNTKLNDNSFSNNYWSEYSGYDRNKDGIGDIPYRPVKLFSYIVNKTPETIVLLRSLFVFIINFSEKVSPIFTPDNLVDDQPRMRPLS